LRSLPILVVMTSVGHRTWAQETVTGADETLLAPVSHDRLLAVVDRHLQRTRSRQRDLDDAHSRLDAVVAGLTTSTTVATATGILMGRLNIGPAQARDRLTAVSTATGRSVLEVAEQVIRRQSRTTSESAPPIGSRHPLPLPTVGHPTDFPGQGAR
jgi:AmiR/NasT family two-component response regulator